MNELLAIYFFYPLGFLMDDMLTSVSTLAKVHFFLLTFVLLVWYMNRCMNKALARELDAKCEAYSRGVDSAESGLQAVLAIRTVELSEALVRIRQLERLIEGK